MEKIFDITFKSEDIKPFSELFDERFYEDDSAFFVSKEIFHHEEDGYSFDYQFAIDVVTCDGKVFYQLELVPCFNSLCDKAKENVLRCSGIDEDDADCYDVESYGYGICMGTASTDGETIDEHTIDLIASVVDCINGLRGFYLDRPVNMIGITGWNMINESVNGVDAF